MPSSVSRTFIKYNLRYSKPIVSARSFCLAIIKRNEEPRLNNWLDIRVYLLKFTRKIKFTVVNFSRAFGDCNIRMPSRTIVLSTMNFNINFLTQLILCNLVRMDLMLWSDY
jgi:hypothetical protein